MGWRGFPDVFPKEILSENQMSNILVSFSEKVACFIKLKSIDGKRSIHIYIYIY